MKKLFLSTLEKSLSISSELFEEEFNFLTDLVDEIEKTGQIEVAKQLRQKLDAINRLYDTVKSSIEKNYLNKKGSYSQNRMKNDETYLNWDKVWAISFIKLSCKSKLYKFSEILFIIF